MKNIILKSITAIATIAWLFTICMADTDAYFAQIMTVNIASGLWIILFCFANGELADER